MQTTHTTTTGDSYGSFKHTKTLSVRRRPGMPGAYVRHRIEPVGFAPVRREDTGWRYANNYGVLAHRARKYNRDLFALLYPAE